MAGRPKRRKKMTEAEQRERAAAIRAEYLRQAEQEMAKKRGTEKYIRRLDNLNGRT